ncbi:MULTISPECIES: SoxR reducing system RseC family protein [Glaesserella]|uniref:Transcriptional regulator n=1 Tax=Glaesserella australis TaxID=2094024 RepID=A0A328C3N0_9PAST|nr:MULTISPECIES: SoxR reducing system RseC family protein [Glaesserella]AUI65455.1 transcriptional regulator [Glaesserella sp. 15-184]RAL19650.1 transcriptional regulator [Glaesserella australis]
MMVEQATVIGYQNGIAKIQCQAKSGCGGCSANYSCGTKALSALAGEKFAPQFELSVDVPLNIGDRIEIGMAEQSLLLSVFWLYVIPLLVVIVSTLVLSQWIHNELWVALGILLSIVITFFWVKKKIAQKAQAQFIPVFLRKI